jgi:hypothetical protein
MARVSWDKSDWCFNVHVQRRDPGNPPLGLRIEFGPSEGRQVVSAARETAVGHGTAQLLQLGQPAAQYCSSADGSGLHLVRRNLEVRRRTCANCRHPSLG